ncbi:alanyl-tRNA editing protein [Candidatus Bathyarchaeota archaeon]|nr:alanyl-tRNA editing protein [Candidatus Bathyarchaeota archaeon]
MMLGTERLYNIDAYIKRFDATIIGLNDEGVILDRTSFYPEGGGQAGDTGFINRFRVKDTRFIGDEIVHILEESRRLNVGERVKGEIDWERRYNIMRLHSAAHIMEFFLFKTFGTLRRIGSYVNEVKDRADYEYDGKMSVEALKVVEAETNRFISESHPIVIYLDPSNVNLRIWKCSWMEMPCGGTHVKNTREIGSIRLKRKNPGRGVERVETYLAEPSNTAHERLLNNRTLKEL